MKINYLLPTLLVASVGFFAFEHSTGNAVVQNFNKHALFTGGGQSGLTGAPGENNCTQCHNGQSQSGANENILTVLSGTSPVLTYIPGQSYNVSLVMNSNPAKKGFSSVALDPSNTNAGSFTAQAVGGTQKFSAGGRDYVSHKSTSSTSSTSMWVWTWTAPATNVGNVTFYVASNKANNNGSDSGDIIYLSQHILSPDAAAGGSELPEIVENFSAGYSPSSHAITMDITSMSVGEMFFNLVDMNGRSVFTYKMGTSSIGENQETVTLPAEIENGIYVVNCFIGNKAMAAKVLVQH